MKKKSHIILTPEDKFMHMEISLKQCDFSLLKYFPISDVFTVELNNAEKKII